MDACTSYPMHDYQKRVVSWLTDRQDGYLAVDMGMGKTRCVLEYLKATGRKALIVAPLQVALHTWPKEIAKWCPEVTYSVVHGVQKADAYTPDPQILITNYDSLKWIATQSRVPLTGRSLILDEATAVKSHRSVRTKLLAGFRVHFSECFCLSATPAPNGVIDLWAQFRVMDGGQRLGKTWTPFFKEFFDEVCTHRVVPKAHTTAVITNRVADAFLRLDAKDYLDVPPIISNDLIITLPPAVMSHYHQLKRQMALFIGDENRPQGVSENDYILAKNSGVLSCKLRQFLQGAIYKDDKTVHSVHNRKLVTFEEVHESLHGQPHLVVISYKFELTALRTRYGDIPVIAGETSQTDRLRYLNEWNEGALPMLVIHPAAVSHGVNLQDGGHYLTWLALPWSLEQYTQVNGRLHRQGQAHPVVRTRILVEDTIDAHVARALDDKNATQAGIFRLITDYIEHG